MPEESGPDFSAQELADYIQCPFKHKSLYLDGAPPRFPWSTRLGRALRQAVVAIAASGEAPLDRALDRVRDLTELEFVDFGRRVHHILGEPVDHAVKGMREWLREVVHDGRLLVEPGAVIIGLAETDRLLPGGTASVGIIGGCDYFFDSLPRLYSAGIEWVSPNALGCDAAFALRAMASDCPNAWKVDRFGVKRGHQRTTKVRIKLSAGHVARAAVLAARGIAAGDFGGFASPTDMRGCLLCGYSHLCGRFPVRMRPDRV